MPKYGNICDIYQVHDNLKQRLTKVSHGLRQSFIDDGTDVAIMSKEGILNI